MTIKYLPDTINYHFTEACNMRCRYCFAVFSDCGLSRKEERFEIITALAKAPVAPGLPGPRRLNFVGGEPTILPYFPDLVSHAVDRGFTVSLVTNGTMLLDKGFPAFFNKFKMIGLSIDSLDPATNAQIGRTARNRTITRSQWEDLCRRIKRQGIQLKINTVVSRFNAHEDLSGFIEEVDPDRWKIFQALPVEDQNGHSRQEWEIDSTTFDSFVERHRKEKVKLLCEENDIMRGSYAMISPDGRFFDNVVGRHQYSDPILQIGVAEAWSQISFFQDRFQKRTEGYQL